MRLLILNWIGKNLEGCENPRQHGKPLVGNNAGVWRYRVGNYRILADILDDKLIIQGHQNRPPQKCLFIKSHICFNPAGAYAPAFFIYLFVNYANYVIYGSMNT